MVIKRTQRMKAGMSRTWPKGLLSLLILVGPYMHPGWCYRVKSQNSYFGQGLNDRLLFCSVTRVVLQ